MIRELIRTAAFAVSARPSKRRLDKIKENIRKEDDQRAKGVMSSLSRGSVLLQLEEVHDGESGSNGRR